jgi:peroxiredoxin
MKQLLVLIFFSPMLAIAQKSLSVSGKIEGLKEQSPISLTDINSNTDTIAKAIVKKDGFALKGTLKTPMMLTLNMENNKKAVLFLENSSVTITGNINDLPNLKITGSASQGAFDAFQKKFNPLFERINKHNQQIQYSGMNEDIASEIKKTKDDIQTGIDQFIKTYKASPVSSFLLLYTIELTDNTLLTEKRFNSLNKTATNNFFGDYLKKTISETKMFSVGSLAMDFSQTDTLGNPISLSSFRGKYVLVDFWASWCGPCRQENPNVVQNFNKFKDKKFTVLGVSLDRPGQKDKWLQAIHADNLAWTHVSDLNFWSNAVALQYKIQSIPQNFLIGPDGKIVAKNLRGPALQSKLCELLGCN